MPQQGRAGRGHSQPGSAAALREGLAAARRGTDTAGGAADPLAWTLRVPFIQSCCGRGPRAVLAAGETMERKALIPAVMDTLLLQGGADGRNRGLGYLLLSFVNRW